MDVLTHETLENAYQTLEKTIKRLPASKARESAEHHLEISEAAAHRAQELGEAGIAEGGC